MVFCALRFHPNRAIRFMDEALVAAFPFQPLEEQLDVFGLPCHANNPHVLMELIIRTPPLEGEVAGDVEVT